MAFDFTYRGKSRKILLAYVLSKEIINTIMMLYKSMKAFVRSPDQDTIFFDIISGISPGETFVPCIFIICLDYLLRTPIDPIKENSLRF